MTKAPPDHADWGMSEITLSGRSKIEHLQHPASSSTAASFEGMERNPIKGQVCGIRGMDGHHKGFFLPGSSERGDGGVR